MTTPRDIAVLVGSLRKESFTRKVAIALTALAAPLLGPNGEIVNPSTRDFRTKAMVAFSDWVELFRSVHASV